MHQLWAGWTVTGTATGIDEANNPIWLIQQLIDTDTSWLSTGLNELFISHETLADALTFYLQRYPQTWVIQLILDGKYHHIDIQKSYQRIIINTILGNLKQYQEM